MIRHFLIFVFVFFLTFSFQSQNIYTFAGNGGNGVSGDGGSALSAQIGSPFGITVDGLGNIYFCDGGNYRIRRIDASGIISTIAGGGTSTVEGVPAITAMLGAVSAITIDASGTIYFTETAPDRIRKISPSGILNTIAGNGSQAFSGDGGQAILASFYNPSGVAVDASGNIYISDSGNNRIRKINSSGIVNTIAGIGTNGFSGDAGLASSAELFGPAGLILGPSGNLIFADYFNNRVREISSSGIINTIAGTGTLGYSGDGGSATSAQISNPFHLVLDGSGNLYFTEYWRIRKLDNLGVISTVSGATGFGYAGDGGLASFAKLYNPVGLVMDTSGNLYISDSGNGRIREICFNACSIGIAENKLENEVKLFPIPANSYISLETGNINIGNSQLEITNMLGERVLSSAYTDKIDVSNLSNGIYNLQIVSPEAIVTKKIVIQH